MEFWGVKVKSGKPVTVEPEDETVLHLSQASLSNAKRQGNESVILYVNIGGQKLVIGTLSAGKFPQLSFDLVFGKKFELSHNSKDGSVYFTGYKAHIPFVNDDNNLASVKTASTTTSDSDAKNFSAVAAKPKEKFIGANKNAKDSGISDSDDEDTDDSSSEDDDSEDKDMADIDESSEEDDDDSDQETSSDVDKPQTSILKKKRPASPAVKPASDKKAKFVTPQKTGGKKGTVHVATPYPSKQHPAKATNNQLKKQTPSSPEFTCKSCNKSFKSDQGLQSHNQAKHSDAS